MFRETYIVAYVMFLGLYFTDAPIVKCDTKHAYVGDKNVFLRCEVKAKPAITAMFWIIDKNGTTVAPGNVVYDHWIINMVSFHS